MVKLVPSGFALGLIQLVVDFCNEVRCLLCKSAKSMINKLGQSMTKQDKICCASGTAAVSAATLACYIYWAIKCASDIFRPSKTRIDLIRNIWKNSGSGRTSLQPCHLTKIINRWPHDDTCSNAPEAPNTRICLGALALGYQSPGRSSKQSSNWNQSTKVEHSPLCCRSLQGNREVSKEWPTLSSPIWVAPLLKASMFHCCCVLDACLLCEAPNIPKHAKAR